MSGRVVVGLALFILALGLTQGKEHEDATGSGFSIKLRPSSTGTAAVVGGDFAVRATATVLQLPDLIFADSFEGFARVPAGSVLFFSESTCPEGWQASPWGGFAFLGLPPAGTIGGIQGPIVTDLGARVHGHGISSSAPLATGSVDTAHVHSWSYLQPELRWVSYTSTGATTQLIQWTNGLDAAGSGTFPFVADPGEAFYTSSTGSHGHGFMLNLRSNAAASAHPYIQLLACEKL